MFEVFNEMYPETKNMDPLPLSEYSLHAIGTPIVEVGDDLKTARALYYSTGMLYRRISTSSKQMAVWMLERYGEDYVREDGFWKIVHECVLNDAGGAQDVTNFAIDCYNKFNGSRWSRRSWTWRKGWRTWRSQRCTQEGSGIFQDGCRTQAGQTSRFS